MKCFISYTYMVLKSPSFWEGLYACQELVCNFFFCPGSKSRKRHIALFARCSVFLGPVVDNLIPEVICAFLRIVEFVLRAHVHNFPDTPFSVGISLSDFDFAFFIFGISFLKLDKVFYFIILYATFICNCCCLQLGRAVEQSFPNESTFGELPLHACFATKAKHSAISRVRQRMPASISCYAVHLKPKRWHLCYSYVFCCSACATF